jgi:UDP-glucose 4-epimerase
MNFVLTGHKGLIGTALLNRLLHAGHNPVSLVDLRSGDDIRMIGSCLVDKPVDIVYHLAAFCKIRDCIDDPHKAFEHNVLGTFQVMEFCALNKIPKIVFTSSTRVLYPEKNPYTASKIYGEELVKSYGIEYVIVRPSTVYGPFNDLTERLTHKFMTAALEGRDLIIYGDRNKTLDFTYIDDFVSALIMASKETNRSFDIGSGHATRICDVAELIIDLVGSKSQIIYAEAERLQPQQVVIETSDFVCPTSVEDGMKKTLEFWMPQRH